MVLFQFQNFYTELPLIELCINKTLHTQAGPFPGRIEMYRVDRNWISLI